MKILIPYRKIDLFEAVKQRDEEKRWE